MSWVVLIIMSILLGIFGGDMVYRKRKTKGNPFGEIFLWLLHILFAILFVFFIGLTLIL